MKRRLIAWIATGNREVGQSMALFGGLAVLIFAMVGLSVDVGQIVATRTTLQKASDAAALAGAQELPNASSATSVAMTYAASNSPAGTTAEVAIGTKYYTSDSVTVTSKKEVRYTFLRVVGLRGTSVSATSTARRGTMSGGFGIVPWGLVASNDGKSTLNQNPCYGGKDASGQYVFKQNVICTLKYGAGTTTGGDFGALTVDQPGADAYRASIGSGSRSTITVGQKIDSETGNMTGPTTQGMGDRMTLAAPKGCPGNARDDVLLKNADGSVSIRPGCEGSPRLVILPIVDKIANPEKSTILGFAVMFLHSQSGSGGHATVTGEFVTVVSSNSTFVYNGTSPSGSSAILLEK